MKFIDFHAHILPGADHGSRSLETSEKQLKYLFDAGVSEVVATPHFYPQRHSVSEFLERRSAAGKKLISQKKDDIPQVYLGAEVLVCGGMDHMPGLDKLCIDGTNVILLEMPFTSWREEHYEAVYRIIKMGLVPVMAHLDRYPEEDVARLVCECDVLCQINAESVKTFKGRKKLRFLFDNCEVAAFGSDIHGEDKKAARALSKLYKATGEAGLAVLETSRTLLSGAKNIFE